MNTNTWQQQVMSVLRSYKKELKATEYVHRIYIDTTPNKAIHILCQMFRKIENNILKEHKKPYVTDNYENDVMHFAAVLLNVILNNRSIFEKCPEYKKLLGQRHISYSIFDFLYNNDMDFKDYKEIVSSEKDMYAITFHGLVNFYAGYYGRFSDNTKAIVLLCSFYRKDIEENEEFNVSFTSALYKHITNAGTPNDLGYAFSGIEQIEKYIGNLPKYIIVKLLRMYGLFYILNDNVRRHQIFTIIEYSGMTNEDKQECKFFFLDSLLIADRLDKELSANYDKMPQIFGGKVILHYDLPEQNLQMGELLVFDKPRSYWTNADLSKRYFFVDEMCLLEIRFDNPKISVKNKQSNNFMRIKLFDYTDWTLDIYHSREFENEAYNFIMSAKIERIPVQMAFSVVHLENYRGIAKRTLDFDHRFEITEKKQLRKRENKENIKLYGKNIYSMTCIVGKNGTGKTSIIDFLRESFFKLLKLIDDTKTNFDEGYIDELDYDEYGVLDKNVKFLVVFKMGTNDFYLTNDKKVKIPRGLKIKPYRRMTFNSWNDLSKIVYFSSMLSLNQNFFPEDEIKRYNAEDESTKEKSNQMQVLKSFRQIDCSEKNSYLIKMHAVRAYEERLQLDAKENSDKKSQGKNEGQLNKELYIQLSFLEQLTEAELKDDLDMDESKEFCINSKFLKPEDSLEMYSLEKIKNSFQQGEFNEYLHLPDSKINYFSSGQYAKFAFLSKLVWITKGYQIRKDNPDLIMTKTQFSDDDALLPGDSVVIFIDEGELYYHPEWQRKYVKNLLDVIRDHDGAIQIIITTNSPFILSDIQKEDVCYLSDRAEVEDETLGQNIHKLLKDNFFMEYTIGEYSRILIEKIISWLTASDEAEKEKIVDRTDKVLNELQEFYEQKIEKEEMFGLIDMLIDQIGEPIYRDTLKRMLEQSPFFDEHELNQLKEERKRIEEEIIKLEKKIIVKLEKK